MDDFARELERQGLPSALRGARVGRPAGVDQGHEARVGASVDELDMQGAGDQGLMFGYASDDTPELMPLPITIAHRLSTAEVADEVIVVDAGRAVQRGSHADLVDVPGRYADLHRSWSAHRGSAA